MNRPLNAPCWVVYTRVGDDNARYYVAGPDELDRLRSGTKPLVGRNYDGYFSVVHVEPFLNKDDAIACALLVDGAVAEFEAGKKWSTDIEKAGEDRFQHNDSDWGTNGGAPYVDEG